MSFFKLADRPWFAVFCSQGIPQSRRVIGPIDWNLSFGVQLPAPDRARRAAKACRNVVRPLTRVVDGLIWIQERAMGFVRAMLRTFRKELDLTRIPKPRFLAWFGRLADDLEGQPTCDCFGGVEECVPTPRRTGTEWVIYRTRESGSRRRFKLGISSSPKQRAKALAASRPRVLATFMQWEVAFAVEQGLHALLYPYCDPRRFRLHSNGDTEWYRSAAAPQVMPIVRYFTRRVRACLLLRDQLRSQ